MGFERTVMADNSLSKSKCVPCQGGIEPLKGDMLKTLMSQLSSEWQIVNEHHLERDFKFKNFQEALDFVNRVGRVAESESHHPDIYLSWGKVKLTLWTHKIKGLHKNDFILASKIDNL